MYLLQFVFSLASISGQRVPCSWVATCALAPLGPPAPWTLWTLRLVEIELKWVHKYELGVSLLDPWALWTLLGLVGLKKQPFCGLDGSLATPLGPHVDPMGAPLRQFWCLQRPLGGPRGSPEVPRIKPAIARLSTCRAEGCVLCFRT